VYSLLSRYGSWIFEEPIALGLGLLEQSINDRLEERAWLYYCCTLPYQDSKHRKSFSDILKDLKRPQQQDGKKSSVTQEDLNRYADIADLMRSR
jgi:hypothetical protein